MEAGEVSKRGANSLISIKFPYLHQKLLAQRNYEVLTENYFFAHHKNSQKHNQHFKLLFFVINFHFITSNQIYRYRKLNLSLTNNFYLVFLPLEM